MKNENNVVIIDAIEKAEQQAKQYLLETTIKSEENLSELIQVYSDVEINDVASYEFAVKGSKEMKKIRNLIDKNRKELTKPVTDFRSNIISLVKPWIEQLTEAETEINEKTKAFEDKAKAEAAAKLAERIELISSNGFDFVAGNYVCGPVFLTVEQIENFSDEEIEFHVQIGKKEVARREAEEKRKAEEKAAFEKRLADLEKREAELAKREAELQGDKVEVDKIIEKIDEKFTPAKKTEKNKPVETADSVEPKKIENPQQKTRDLMSLGREAGFNAFRKQLIELLDSGEKLSRKGLKEWAQNLSINNKQK